LPRSACSDRPTVDGADDLPEGWGRQVSERLTVLGAIEDIEELAPELKLRALGKRDALG
jgi:hypothetical protein